ncbi:uncharacterized protein LOC114280721 [Camellia sinensis]|uniref:uncharacterized protein LOC114280721 n=1 Tax=Camellia sinensis TaxID=4442 RepID=UPI001036B400|nr:uncharacterized protein LOC114280721 [Camellia sinensis]
MFGDRPLTANDSAIENVEVDFALSMAMLLLVDMNHMANLHEYENFNLMMQHFVLAKVAKAAQDQAEAKVEAAEATTEAAKANVEAVKARAADFEAKLKKAIELKEAEVNTADEKAFEKVQAAFCDQYKDMPFPPSLKDSEDEAEEEETEAEDANEEEEVAVGAKSLTLNDQVLDLTQDEEDEVSKSASPKKTTSQAEVQTAKKSLDETLLKIDAKIQAEKTVKKTSQLSAKAKTPPTAKARQSIQDRNT